MVKYLLILLIVTGCTSAEKKGNDNDTVIIIEISKEGTYTINQELVPEDTLQDYLLGEIKKLEKAGYQREEIIADIRTHPETKLGQVSHVQVALKNLAIRKVLYSNIPTEPVAVEKSL